ncbi:hypothetical protein BDD14_5962 [Edaphobacter modestus]|uniref:Uncharacterized protein n=1 Tax=Edaphobacter modestus TaxID=388466 RepID=A0A4Q7YD38_9BACT|nr:hypothetical protein BDD14_5962 [Edaphobacter modestus]
MRRKWSNFRSREWNLNEAVGCEFWVSATSSYLTTVGAAVRQGSCDGALGISGLGEHRVSLSLSSATIGSWHSSEANDATLRGNYYCAGAIIYTQFRKDMFHVALDGLFADGEGGGDFLVAVAPCYK